MTFEVSDRIKESTSTTGIGTYSLGGTSPGFQTFVAGVGNGNICPYIVTDGTNYEVGIGTVTASTPDILSRDVILESSNGDAAVNWGIGNKNVACVFASALTGSFGRGVESITADHTINVNDNGRLFLANASAGAFTQTLPALSSVWGGFSISVMKSDSSTNAITVDGASAETINGTATRTISDQFALETYISDGTEWKVLLKALASQAEAEAGTDNTKLMTPLRTRQAIVYPPNYISGGDITITANTTISIPASSARDSSDTANINLAAQTNRDMNVVFAKGGPGMGPGALAANTLYYVFVIREDATGDIDVYGDTSSTGVNKPAGWTIEQLPPTGSELYMAILKTDPGAATLKHKSDRHKNRVIDIPQTATGTVITFLAPRVNVMQVDLGMTNLGTSTTTVPGWRIGDSSGIKTTGYLGAASQIGAAVSSANHSARFQLSNTFAATNRVQGVASLKKLSHNANIWAYSQSLGLSDVAVSYAGGGFNQLTLGLDRVDITGGTFNSGTVYVIWHFNDIQE